MENFNHGKIEKVNIASEMKSSFLDYSMSVIIARALPDVRDGLKPVHRRIIYAMLDLGMLPTKPHRKSARIVGEVIGKYHPHGDTAVYESMVRMAQDFSYRYPLVEGHGNFGSVDGDSAAAMRYTEARMSKISLELVRELEKETVSWSDNYDAELKEPDILPCRFPNLLVNGSTGIAVGMATNMPPHNLKEVIDAAIAIIDNPDIEVVDLINNYIKGPDFPTAACILGRSGIKKAYETGKGSIIVRAKAEIIEKSNGIHEIIISELPYMVNKQELLKKIHKLASDKVIEGISNLVDLSNRNGIKIVFTLKKGAQPQVVLNQLYRQSQLQTTFGVNNVVLVDNTPRLLNLKELFKYYIKHQEEIIRNATIYDLRKAKERMHILEALKVAVDNIDETIKIIRANREVEVAKEALIKRFDFTEIQAKAILDMQLKRLTGFEIEKIINEINELSLTIADYEDILNNYERIVRILKENLLEIKEKYGDERRTEIIEDDSNIEDEELIPVEDIVVSLTNNGYIKRMTIDNYKTQNRGGKGVKGMSINENDEISQFLNMSTHDHLLLFSSKGKVYRTKGYRIPEGSRIAKGLPIVNLLELEKDEIIKVITNYNDNDLNLRNFFIVTKLGKIKKIDASEFKNINRKGKIIYRFNNEDNDELNYVLVTNGNDEIIIGSSDAQAVKFTEESVRSKGRIAAGVKGINLNDKAYVVGASVVSDDDKVLCITKKGIGKLTLASEYRLTNRGTKGVIAIKLKEGDELVTLTSFKGSKDCLIMTNNGQVIRINLDEIRDISRNAQGVKFINLNEDSFVTAVTLVDNMNKEVEESD